MRQTRRAEVEEKNEQERRKRHFFLVLAGAYLEADKEANLKLDKRRHDKPQRSQLEVCSKANVKRKAGDGGRDVDGDANVEDDSLELESSYQRAQHQSAGKLLKGR